MDGMTVTWCASWSKQNQTHIFILNLWCVKVFKSIYDFEYLTPNPFRWPCDLCVGDKEIRRSAEWTWRLDGVTTNRQGIRREPKGRRKRPRRWAKSSNTTPFISLEMRVNSGLLWVFLKAINDGIKVLFFCTVPTPQKHVNDVIIRNQYQELFFWSFLWLWWLKRATNSNYSGFWMRLYWSVTQGKNK